MVIGGMMSSEPSARIAIRRLLPSDQAFLWEMLYQSLHVPAGAAPLPRDVLLRPEVARYAEGFGRGGDLGVVALQTESGAPVGAAWVRLLTGDARGYGYVDDDTPELGMAVLAGFRGRGIGTTLLEHLLTLAADRCRKVCLSVSSDNPAMRLYLRAGFTVVASSDGTLTMVRSVGR